ncbi:hypothetical protein JHN52_00530 [Streptomyces sp. MBT97]|uniref:hypothetical protein n=1 Tax=Streptomyces sp. MBT97 TaxID=2800411 RepID=UPI00190BBF2F|nr:hypothetical protein [Streptomyces sp. MBT97]MBK3631466.1 hypothetical protein [Streptomyces sp. MBT97]
MRPSTLRTLNRAAELTRQNRLTEAMLIAEPVILTADEYESAEIRRWLLDHVADFTGENQNHDEPKELP